MDEVRASRYLEKSARLAELHARLGEFKVDAVPLGLWLKRPENSHTALPEAIASQFPADVWMQLETDLKYAGYIQRQEEQIARTARHEGKKIPDWIDYALIKGLRTEAVQKLSSVRPETLGQASRLSGVTPSDIALLGVWIVRGSETPTHST